jgi:hypothetical protein
MISTGTSTGAAVEPTAARGLAPWPSARSRRSAIVAQFGGERANLAHWALTTADPLADAVADAIHSEGGAVRAAFSQGVTDGLASLANPHPAVAALLASTEALPGYADDELLDHGSAPYYTSPMAVHLVSLSAGALIRVYDSPSIAGVLAATGRLVDGAERRIRETGQWVATAMLPGALRVGELGYVATLQVRLLHAQSATSPAAAASTKRRSVPRSTRSTWPARGWTSRSRRCARKSRWASGCRPTSRRCCTATGG